MLQYDKVEKPSLAPERGTCTLEEGDSRLLLEPSANGMPDIDGFRFTL
jgi:hypothetical protein